MNNTMVMKKPIEVWQAVVGTLLLLMGVGSVIINQSNKIQSQQDMINFLIENKGDQRMINSEINASLKELNKNVNEILIELQNKEDKKK